MKSETLEKLALIYVQKHTDAETTPTQVHAMYEKAVEEIRQAESSAHTVTGF